ncbi:PH domain-containing protein [Acidovorax sp. SUPP2539]|uniref:PH domain-containing protein n=1 Tax=Acidovorax sp. SUPP2539 TaxID=2920878 RepID=UPI0023DE3E94|nr:PH domain-containing protein [Acidovorax sp. SUPP2539]GKS92628.1 PH domain-containing protein [Acidovorax sp. SUPP2539]
MPIHDAPAPAMDSTRVSHAAESTILWSSSEGQITNAGAFTIALLFCWLVVPVAWALYRYLRTANHRYVLTDQRLLEHSGIVVKRIEALELYRVKDLSVSGNLLQTVFGRGRIVLLSTDSTNPTLVIDAVPNAAAVSQLIRDAVERCRAARGVRAFDY